MLRLLKIAILIPCFLGLGNSPAFSETQQTDLCQVTGFIQSLRNDRFRSLEGPIKGCNKGDTIHFQVDGTKVPYASLVGRYCNLRDAVVIEKFKQYVHIVCTYHWKWARQVEMTIHPDDRNK